VNLNRLCVVQVLDFDKEQRSALLAFLNSL